MDDMLPPKLAEVVTHREVRLARTDDHGLHALHFCRFFRQLPIEQDI